MIIVCDTETTGLINHPSTPLDQQPEIIEFAGVKLDAELNIIDSLQFFAKPRILPLPAKITEMTGITTDQLVNEKPFARSFSRLADFFLGTRQVIAHNCSYDIGMMKLELTRLDLMAKFPWPPIHTCTVEANMDILGRRMRLGELYKHVTGRDIVGAHRAMNDVEGLVEIVRWMKAQGKL